MIKKFRKKYENKKYEVMEDKLVSRNELREIMSILPTEYLYEKENIAPAIEYLDVLNRIKHSISIYYNFGCVKTYRLTQKQEHLAEIILRYAIEGVYERVDDVYHELYDFIDNRADETEYLSYVEVITLKNIVNSVIYKLEKEIEHKEVYKYILKLVNECICTDEYINYGKIFLLKEKYISNNQNLTKYEKLYLKNKLERSYEEFIINISKGNINIFKYKKNDIKYEHIYRTIVAYMKNNYKKNKIKKNIIHLLNGSKNIKNKDNINYLIDIM